MIRLTKEKVLALRKTFAKRFGCDPDPRDGKPLDTLLLAAFARGTDGDALPSVEEKAARIAYDLVTKRMFRTGNAAFGVFMLLIYLEASGLSPTAAPEEITAVGLSLGSGRMTYEALVSWARQNVK